MLKLQPLRGYVIAIAGLVTFNYGEEYVVGLSGILSSPGTDSCEARSCDRIHGFNLIYSIFLGHFIPSREDPWFIRSGRASRGAPPSR